MNRILTAFIATAIFAGAAFAGPKEDIEANLRAGHWQEAETQLHGVLEKHPNNALAHYWMAQAEYRQGKTQEAAGEARRAVEIDPARSFATDTKLLDTILASGNARVDAGSNATRPAITTPAPQAAPKSSSFGSVALIVLVFIAGGALLWFVNRSREDADKKAEREHWSGRLRQAITDLKDAVKASEADPQSTPEVKLANYDRAQQLQGSINNHLAGIASRTDYSETNELINKAHDVAAQIRGEEPPSVRQQRLDAERQANMQAAYAQQQMPPAYGYGPGGMPAPGGSGALGTIAAVGIGAAAGMLLAEAAEASTGHHAHRSERYEGSGSGSGSNSGSDWDDDLGSQSPPQTSSGLDLGGSGDSASDWSSGGDDSFN